MIRCWLLTWTTYGSWLPGDRRGFVSPVADSSGKSVLHNQPGTPYDARMPALRDWARQRLKSAPIFLRQDQASIVLEQISRTIGYRRWTLLAAAVMRDHVHVVVKAPEEVRSDGILRDLKSYASRALNETFGRPAAGTWWTESGSKRSLPNDAAAESALRYVRAQANALALWPPSEPERGASAPC